MMEALEDKERRKIYKWLAAPDPHSNHERARQKHQPDTGKWLLDGHQYNEWKNASSSFLWLHGIRKYFKSIPCKRPVIR